VQADRPKNQKWLDKSLPLHDTSVQNTLCSILHAPSLGIHAEKASAHKEIGVITTLNDLFMNKLTLSKCKTTTTVTWSAQATPSHCIWWNSPRAFCTYTHFGCPQIMALQETTSGSWLFPVAFAQIVPMLLQMSNDPGSLSHYITFGHHVEHSTSIFHARTLGMHVNDAVITHIDTILHDLNINMPAPFQYSHMHWALDHISELVMNHAAFLHLLRKLFCPFQACQSSYNLQALYSMTKHSDVALYLML
jgi:hypothetical protein